MTRSWFNEEQIIRVLKEGEAGTKVSEPGGTGFRTPSSIPGAEQRWWARRCGILKKRTAG